MILDDVSDYFLPLGSITNIDRPLGPWIAPIMFALSGPLNRQKPVKITKFVENGEF